MLGADDTLGDTLGSSHSGVVGTSGTFDAAKEMLERTKASSIE